MIIHNCANAPVGSYEIITRGSIQGSIQGFFERDSSLPDRLTIGILEDDCGSPLATDSLRYSIKIAISLELHLIILFLFVII